MARLTSLSLIAAPLLALASTAGASAASSPAETATPELHAPIRLKLVGAAPCIDAPALWSALRDQSARVRPAIGAQEGANELSLALTSDSDGTNAVLSLRFLSGRFATRTLHREHCEDLLPTIALVIALAFDEEESARTAPAPTSSAPPMPRATATSRTSGSNSNAGSPLTWSLGGRFSVAIFEAPAVAVGPSAFLAVEGQRWAIRASFAHLASDVAIGRYGRASFRWWLGSLEVQPFALSPMARVLWSPSIGLEAGALRADSTGLLASQSATRPWVAPFALSRLRWLPFDHLALDLDLGISLPLYRDRFLVSGPQEAVFQAPTAVLLASIGASMRFP